MGITATEIWVDEIEMLKADHEYAEWCAEQDRIFWEEVEFLQSNSL